MRKITILLFLFPFLVCAQIKKGNKLYDQFLYSEAIEYFLSDATSKDSLVKFEAIKKLSDCYINTNNIEESIVWLNKLKHYEASRPMVYYQLGLVLMKNQEYERAFNQFSIFNSSYKATEASRAYAHFCENINQLQNNDSIICEPVTSINSANSDFSPIYFNGFLYFSSDRDYTVDGTYGWTNFGYIKQFEAKTGSFTNVFSQPETPYISKSEALNQHLHCGPISISKSANRYFITRTNVNDAEENENATIQLSLYYGDLINNEFQEPKPFPFNNKQHNIGHATLSFDGNMVIFSADVPGGNGEGDLYSSYFKNGSWTKPRNIGDVINDFGNEVFPYLHNDTTLFFSSTSHFGYGGLDCFVSYKRTTGEWSEPQNLRSPINSSYDDFGIYFYEDLKHGYVSSDRPGGSGSDDIYAFKYNSEEYLVESPSPGIVAPVSYPNESTVCGYVKDRKTREPISNAHVFVLHPVSKIVSIYTTDDTGRFEIEVPDEKLLIFHAAKESYSETVYQCRFPLEVYDLHCLPEDLYLDRGGKETFDFQTEIYYDLDKDNIRQDAKLTLDKVVKFVREIDSDYLIYLDSHTDTRASEEYNQALSLRRAQNAKIFLIDHGVPAHNISFEWHGEEKLRVGGKDDLHLHEDLHQKNRRTGVIVEYDQDTEYELSIDLSVYEAGDEFPLQIFPRSFFAKEHYTTSGSEE